jgi:hypothetical protein
MTEPVRPNTEVTGVRNDAEVQIAELPLMNKISHEDHHTKLIVLPSRLRSHENERRS